MTDDKPTNTISLAAERGKRERDFAAERDLLTRELADIGVPPEKASAIVADLLLIDWWCLQAVTILERWDLEQNAQAAVELVKLWRGRPRDGDDAAARYFVPASPAFPSATPPSEPTGHPVATRLLGMVENLAGQRPSARARQASRTMADVPPRRHRPLSKLERQDRQDGSQRQRGPESPNAASPSNVKPPPVQASRCG